MAQPNPPVVTQPYAGVDFYTNRTSITFSGTVDLIGVTEVLVNGSSTGVSYTPGSGTWLATVTLVNGANTLSFTALSDDATPIESDPESVVVTVTDESQLTLIMTNPTGIRGDVLKDSVKVSWVQNPESQVVGYNIYASDQVGGGNDGYVRLNELPITTVAEVRESSTLTSETIDQSGSTRTTTTVEEVIQTNVYEWITAEFDGEPLSLGQTLYFVVTAVGFDATESEDVESAYSPEISITPLVLSESRINAPTRTQGDVANAFALLIQEAQPNLDIKPGQLTNDVHIQPPATEFEKAYFLLNFLSKAQSLAELLVIDDPNGDGVSDPVDDVPYKRSLKVALNTDDNAIVQQFIDDAFTRLAANNSVRRQEAQKAQNEYIFYTATMPTVDVLIPAGSIVATEGNASQGVSAQQYEVTSTLAVDTDNLSALFNTTTERFEFPVFIRALVAGDEGNQDVGAINIVVSGPNVALEGENPEVLTNGSDLESNARLALRAQLAILGVDSGTTGGYLKTAFAVPSVESASVVGAGGCEMQRDFDCFRRRHEGCKVDLYVKGTILLDRTDEVAFSYFGDEDNVLTIVSAIDFEFEVDSATRSLTVGDDHPLFEITEVFNVTQSVSYDVNNIRFNGDRFTMDTSIPANSGLVGTDLVQATFRFRDGSKIVLANQPVTAISSVTGEVSGALVAGSTYNFDKSADPLLLGRSTLSDDGVYIQKGPGEEITGETHTLVSNTPVELDNVDVATDTIVVKDPTGEITYVLGEDYVLDTFQRVLIEDEEHQLSATSTAFLNFDTVLRPTVVVEFGPTPLILVEGADYQIIEDGLRLGLRRIVGGTVPEGGTVSVTYRIEIPVLVTTIARQVGATPVSSIPDPGDVVLTYNLCIPRGRPLLVEAEEKVLVATEFVELSRKGVIPGTIVVIDPLASSPNTFVEGIDYVIELGDDDTATSIRRLEGGSIVDGSTVEITYRANEKFTVVYSVNDLVRIVQAALDLMRHATADVLAKEVLVSPVDSTITVIPIRGVNRINLITAIKTAISRYYASRPIGGGIFQGDKVDVVEEVTGVDHTVIPFLKMVRARGSIVLRERHRNPNFTLWATGVSKAFRSAAGTTVFVPQAAGGSRYLPRGVFEDDSPMRIVDNITEVEEAYGRAYIHEDGSIIVSPNDELPENHDYTVTYQVGDESGVKDVRLTAIEVANLGVLDVILGDPETSVCRR